MTSGAERLAAGADDLWAELRPRLERAHAAGAKGGSFERIGALELYLKFGPLRGSARRRHALRRMLGHEPPRLAEYDNLRWLREHGFDAPEPLAAGVLGPPHAPSFQYLATARVPGARTLRSLFEDGPEQARVPALARLARDLARLHDAGFVHRDLFPRNLLVTDELASPRLWFLDAWRGGPGAARGAWSRRFRGPAYDLACLMVFGLGLFREDEQRLFFGHYFDARSAPTAARERLLRRAAIQRRALVRHLRRRGRHEPAVPPGDWSPDATLTGGPAGA